MLTPLEAEKHFALIFRCLRAILRHDDDEDTLMADLDAAINRLDGPPFDREQKAALDEAGKG